MGAATSFYLLLAAVPEYARNTVVAPITVPVDVCGNAVAILGFADACCRGGAGVLFLDSFNG